jgi:hypothetical protein
VSSLIDGPTEGSPGRAPLVGAAPADDALRVGAGRLGDTTKDHHQRSRSLTVLGFALVVWLSVPWWTPRQLGSTWRCLVRAQLCSPAPHAVSTTATASAATIHSPVTHPAVLPHPAGRKPSPHPSHPVLPIPARPAHPDDGTTWFARDRTGGRATGGGLLEAGLWLWTLGSLAGMANQVR